MATLREQVQRRQEKKHGFWTGAWPKVPVPVAVEECITTAIALEAMIGKDCSSYVSIMSREEGWTRLAGEDAVRRDLDGVLRALGMYTQQLPDHLKTPVALAIVKRIARGDT